MSKLTDIKDDFTVNSHSEIQGLEGAIAGHLAFTEHARAIPNRLLEPKGWIPSKLYSNFIQSKTLYRKHDTAHDAKIALWLAKAKEQAKQFYIEHQAMPEFTGISKAELSEIAKLSIDENILQELPEILAFKGIILIYLPALEGTKADGATFLLSDKLPVIVHSIRYPRMDNFWFTLLHELAHLCLHFNNLDEPIVDDMEDEQHALKDIEIQADRLAKTSFVSKVEWRTATVKNTSKGDDIYTFAQQMQVHPSIIAGLVRASRSRYDLFSDIVNKVNPRTLLRLL